MNQPLLRRSLVESGDATDASLRTAVRRGDLRRIARGLYTAADHPATHVERCDEYRQRVIAAAASSPGRIVSHQSAAAMLEMPLLSPDMRAVHFSNARGSGSHLRTVHVHPARIEADELTTIEGVRVTTPARTAIDVARSTSFAQGVCAMDSALRHGATLADLRDAVRKCKGRTGVNRARLALPAASELAESIGESYSRVLMLDWPEIPAPRLQHEFFDERGQFVARADFDWDGNIVGEFDGRGKIKTNDDVWEEKIREDRLRELGITVVRWYWDDLMRPARLRAKLRRALSL